MPSATDQSAAFAMQRRGLGTAAAVAAAAGFTMLPRPAMARRLGPGPEQNVVTNGADPTGTLDSTAAFLFSFNNLPSAGGTIYVPGGTYRLDHQLTFKDKPLQILGEGSAATVLLLNHNGWGIQFACTNNGVESEISPLHVVGLSFGGIEAAPAAGAIWASFGTFAGETGYQSCVISDIGIGNSRYTSANGCNILHGLYLENIWKSHIENVRMFGNPSNGGFIVLSSKGGGLVIDNTFINCFHDGGGAGFSFVTDGQTGNGGVFQGVNIISPKLLDDYCIYAPSPGTNIFILGFFMTGATTAARQKAMLLQNVWGGIISDCAFNCSNPNASAVVDLITCESCGLTNCTYNGAYNANTGVGAGTYAISLGGVLNRINGAQMGNVLNGVLFPQGSVASLATGLQLVDPTTFPQVQSGPAAIDQSGIFGNGRCNAQWLNKTGQLVTLY